MARITVQGLEFNVSTPYAEGSVLTANEAGALNQTRAENCRNNFASTIQEACEKAGVSRSADLPEDVKLTLEQQFAEYEASYEFGTRRGRTSDPVESEARRVGRDAVKEGLAALFASNPDYAGRKVSDLKTADIDKIVDSKWEQYGDQWMEQAKRIIEARKASTSVNLSDLMVPGASASEDQSPASPE